jgi:hypothetical protein
MPIKALDDTGSGTIANLAAGILYGAHNGANVLNNSWGCSTPCPSNPVVEQAVQQAHDLGVTVVFAAGNAAADVSQFSRQNSPYVITVAASDQNDQPLYFSNFGLVDVSAPGGAPNVSPPATNPFYNILSLRSAVCDTTEICAPANLVGTDLLRLAGTSMAAPRLWNGSPGSGAASDVLARAGSPSHPPGRDPGRGGKL